MDTVSRYLNLLTLLLVLALWQTGSQSSSAREQWQMQHPAGSAPTGPIMPSGVSQPMNMGLVPKVGPDFWIRQHQSEVPYGTMLGGILQEEVSTRNAKVGDQFHLLLQDGFYKNGGLLIPPGSMLVGTVMTSLPSAMLQHGHPGRMDVSINKLVFPDGRSLPLSAAIDHNPAHDPQDPQKASKVHYTGASVGDYGGMSKSFLGSFTRGVGVINRRYNQGMDFTLKKGTVVPVRLTRNLNIPEPNAPYWANQAAQNTPPTVPGLAGPDPDGPVQAPAMGGFPQGYSQPPPGLTASPGMLTLPQQAQPDPNVIFKQPMHPGSLKDIPDPF